MFNPITYFADKMKNPMRRIVNAEKEEQYVDREMAAGAWADDTILDDIFTNPDDLIKLKGLSVIDELLSDDALGSYVGMKIEARLATAPTIESASDSNKDMQIADYVRWNLMEYCETDIEDFLRHKFSALPYGFSLTEKVLTHVDEGKWKGKFAYSRFIPQNPHHYKFKLDAGKRLAEKGIGNVTGYASTNWLPREKFIHYAHNSAWGNPYGKSDITKAWKWYLGKKYGYRFWLINLERMNGFIDASYDDTVGVKERENLEEILKTISGKTSMYHPKGIEIKITESTGASAITFRNSIEFFNISMARAVLIPDLLGFSAKPSGSYALGKKHFDVFLWVLLAMGRKIERVVREQIIAPLVTLNFGAQYALPRFVFEPLTMEDKLEILASYYTAIEKGVFPPTDETREWVHKMLTAPHYERPEEEIPKKQIVKPEVPPEQEAPDDKQLPQAAADEFVMRKLTPYEAKVRFSDISQVWDTIEETTIQQWQDISIKRRDNMFDMARKIIESKDIKRIDKLRLWKTGAVNKLLHNALITALLNNKWLARQEVQDTLNEDLDIDTFAEILLEPVQPQEALRYFREKGITITPQQANKYKQQAFAIAGVESQQVLAKCKVAILNGLERGSLEYSTSEIRKIFDKYVQTGEIKGGEISSAYHIENVVRTNVAEAVREGRRSAFNDSDVVDYIEAYQISAVLDANTTDLCAGMDGRILSKEELDAFGHPPWHYQCRSLVIPIVRGEEFAIDGIPTGTAQQFGPGGKKVR